MLASEYFVQSSNSEIIYSIRDHFIHNKGDASVFQLSYVMCSYIELLDLIYIQLYNSDEQSEPTQNYQWAFTITNAIYNRLGSVKFLNYTLSGFAKYISIMGKHAIYDHLIAEQLPSENLWRLEWWIVSNIYESIILNDEIEVAVKEEFIHQINSIFSKYNYDFEINLGEGIRRYEEFRVLKNSKVFLNFEYLFHSNKNHYLRSFKNLYQDRIKVGKIAGSIRSNTFLIN
jgi:hypothetical protein